MDRVILTKFKRCLFCLSIAAALFIKLELRAEIPSELVIGVPATTGEINILSSMDPGTRVIRAMVSAPLLIKNKDTNRGLFSLLLADSFQVNSDLTRWSFRIRDSLTFSNGRSIRGADVCASLLNCSTIANQEVQFSSCSVRSHGIESADREWIDIDYIAKNKERISQHAIVDGLATCPIIENSTRTIFGQDYGQGANILSSGEYRLIYFLPHKSYRLERYQRDRLGKPISDQQVEVRYFQTMKEALAALRVGTIGMFVNNEPALEPAITSDETLKIRDCGEDRLVYRRGFQFDCTDGISVSSVVWDLS